MNVEKKDGVQSEEQKETITSLDPGVKVGIAERMTDTELAELQDRFLQVPKDKFDS